MYIRNKELIIGKIAGIRNNEKSVDKINIFLAGILGFIYIMFVLVGRRFMGKLFVGSDKCNSCGYCVKHCPVATISLYNNKP